MANEKVTIDNTLDQRRDMVREALRKHYKPAAGKDRKLAELVEPGCWVRELTDTHAVFEKDGTLMAVKYAIKNGKAVLDEPYKVEIQYVPVED